MRRKLKSVVVGKSNPATTKKIRVVKKVKKVKKVIPRRKSQPDEEVEDQPAEDSAGELRTLPLFPEEPATDDDQAQVDEELSSAVDNLLLRGRAYRLNFCGIGMMRNLTPEERKIVERESNNSVTMGKRLFDKYDPHLKAARTGRESLREYFNRCTIAHPERATRMFVVRAPVDWSSLSKEDSEAMMAEHLEKFHTDMEERIREYREGCVQDVIDNWDEILDRAKSSLGDLFNPSQYPRREELPERFATEFHPQPSVLPPEYNLIKPEMREQVMLYMRRQVESSFALQITAVEDALTESLTALRDRLNAVNGDSGARLYASRIEQVGEVIQSYNDTMQSLGLDFGNGLGDNLKRLRETLKMSGTDPHRVAQTLRNSADIRNKVIDELSKSVSSVTKSFAPVRRRLRVEEEHLDE